MFLEPVIEARLTEVLSTAFSEVRVSKNFGADTALKSFRHWFSEVEVIATKLSLSRDTCCRCDPACHSDLEYSFG